MMCPHCGNRNPDLFEASSDDPRDPDLAVLCLAPCDPRDSYLDHLQITDPMRQTCGFWWEPAGVGHE